MDSLPDLTDSTLWKVIATKSLRQQVDRVAIKPQEFQLARAIASIEAQSTTAPNTWFLAGYCHAFLNLERSRVLVGTHQLALRETALIVLPKTVGNYTLHVTFPRWLSQIRLVVKEFRGVDDRAVDILSRVEQKMEVVTL